MLKRFPSLFIILLLIGGVSISSWLLNQYLHRRVCDQYRVYPIDLNVLQPITQANLQGIQQLGVFGDHFAPEPDIAFSPTSRIIAISTIGSLSSTLLPDHPVIWHFDDGCIQIPGDPTKFKSFLEFSRNGEFFLLHECLVNNCYVLYSSTDGRLIGNYYEAEFVMFPQGEMLAYTSSEMDQRQLLNLSDMRVLSNDISEPYRNALLFSSDYQRLITSDSKGILILWDTFTENQLLEFVDEPEHASDSIKLLQFSPDNRWLVSKFFLETVKVWDVETGELLLSPTEDSVWQDKFAFLSGGRQFVYGHYIWNIDTALPAVNLGDSTFEMLSPDGSFFVTVNDKTVMFWDGETYEPFFSLDFDEEISDVSISPDQKLLAITTVRHVGFETIGCVQLWGISQVTE